jgi:hypothetical protein
MEFRNIEMQSTCMMWGIYDFLGFVGLLVCSLQGIIFAAFTVKGCNFAMPAHSHVNLWKAEQIFMKEVLGNFS